MFEDVTSSHTAVSASMQAREATEAEPEPAGTEGRDQEIAQLTRELAATREYLQDIVEQQEAANEELQTAHEEAQSANEELQSINEELETSKERFSRATKSWRPSTTS
jgi:two-component system CheB/CheR fusion protein